MKLRKALLLIMTRWQVTGYRLAQASGVNRAQLAKLLRGDTRTSNWERVEELANGFERIDPIAKGAFIEALRLPDSTYPSVSDSTIDLFWERESPDNIAAVMAVLDEYKLLNQENLKKLKAKLAEHDAETEAIFPTTVELWIGIKMQQKRRKEDTSDQDG